MKRSVLIAIIIVLVLAIAATVFFVLKSSYDVEFITDGGEIYSEAKIKCQVGETYKLPTPSKKGYDFDGWFTNPEFNGSTVVEFGEDNIFESTDLTFYAKFTKRCEITYVLDGFTTNNPTELRSDESVNLEDPAITGAIFGGWYLDKNYTQPITKIKNPEDDMTIYGRLLQQHSISYNLDGGVNHSSNAEFYASELGLTLYAPTKDGYDFTGWVNENGEQVYSISVNTTGLVSLKATWKPKTYKITWELNGGKAPEGFDINSYVVGEGVAEDAMMIPESKTNIFLYWYILVGETEVRVEEIDNETVGDIVLYAKWLDNTPVEETDIWSWSKSTYNGGATFGDDSYYIKVPEGLEKFAEQGLLGLNIYVEFECGAQTEGDATSSSTVYFEINGVEEEICSVSATGGGYHLIYGAQTGQYNETKNNKKYQVMFEGDEIVLGYTYTITSNSINPLVKDHGSFVCTKLTYSFFILEEPPVEEPAE